MTAPDVMRAADRVWNAAHTLDELLGDGRVSEWASRKVRNLMRAGRADDVREIAKLARVLEDRLEDEQAHRAGPQELAETHTPRDCRAGEEIKGANT